jgi:hypothetical protein
MMALDLSAVTGPVIIRDIEMTSTNATAVILPSWAYVCYLQFYASTPPLTTSSGTFAFTGTDGTAQADEHMRVEAGATFPIPVGASFPSGSRTIYLAGDVALPVDVARIMVVARNMGA